MVHQPSTMNRRLERHHRIDGDLQARARPISLERKSVQDVNAVELVKQIRGLVERGSDEAQDLGRRLVFGPDGNDQNRSSDPASSSTDSPSDGTDSSPDSGDDSTTTQGDSGNQKPTAKATPTKVPDPFPLEGGGDRQTTKTSSSSSSTSSSSTSTTSSSTSSSSTKRIATTTLPSTTSSLTPSTSYAYVTSTPLPSLNAAETTPSPTQTGSSGTSVGPIIGIVAGALAGVAVLAIIIGFLFKKFGRKEDPYEADPFDRDSFRRQSAMLPDAFEDDDHMPEMSEAHQNVGPFGDEHGYMTDAAMGVGAMSAASAYTAHNEGGPRPPTMFANHMNAPAAQMSAGDAPPVPTIGAIYTTGHDPSPQLPPMAFGGSDPYSIAGVGRQHLDNNINNPYGYLDRQYSGNHSPPRGVEQYAADEGVAQQEYATLDRNGSQGSQYQQQQYEEQYSNYEHHNTAGRPGTAEGRSGTPDLPNVQQTYAMGNDDPTDMHQHERVMSPHRNVASPTRMSQELLSNGVHTEPNSFRSAQSNSPSPPQQPLQVRNLLPNPYHQGSAPQQRPISGVSSVADDDAAYGGVW